MCFPPFCPPAERFLCSSSLKTGAAVTLIINVLYGGIMVLIHALMLGNAEGVPITTTEAPVGMGEESQGMGPSGEPSGGTTTKLPMGYDSHWFLQLLDLDFGWGHDLMGFDDYTCLMGGLVYGLLIVVLSGLMFNTLYSQRPGNLAILSRWFVAFLNLEIVLYVIVVFCKLPRLCKFQERYLPALSMDCSLLRYLYLQRVIVFLIIAGLVCWVFSSMAYLLFIGNQAIDRPEFHQSLEMQDEHARAARNPGYTPAGYPPPRAQASVRPLTAGSLAPGSRRGIVGEPVSAGSHHMAPGSMGRMPLSHGGGRPSYSIRGHNFPRNGSSAISTATSHSQAETHALIKGPATIY